MNNETNQQQNSLKTFIERSIEKDGLPKQSGDYLTDKGKLSFGTNTNMFQCDRNYYPTYWYEEISPSSIMVIESEVILPSEEDEEKLIDGLMDIVKNAESFGKRTSLAQIKIFKLILQYKCKIETVKCNPTYINSQQKPLIDANKLIEFIDDHTNWNLQITNDLKGRIKELMNPKI